MIHPKSDDLLEKVPSKYALVIAAARRLQRALVVGYILNVHPSWQTFTALAQTIGKPPVMRMHHTQQSPVAV